MRASLNPHGPATDERVCGRVRDERAHAATVVLTGEEADAMTDRAMIEAMLVDLRDIAYSAVPGSGWSRESVERDLRTLIAKTSSYLESES